MNNININLQNNENKELINSQNVQPVVNTTEQNQAVTDLEKDNKLAFETAQKLKSKGMQRIKIPVDKMNPKDLMIPVVINGYQYLIKRGETVEVPDEVVRILEEAKYI